MDWPALMRAGLRELRLPPDVFWRLSPAELALMLGLDAGTGPMGRDRLMQMMAAFPDRDRPDGESDG